ncbi:Mss4-like protein [Apiospora aurea]|uniref:Mss4-like protein n=1 Tax=Apiospora aurea TaxID=335848 RepID=A0ABR1Q6M2_9PEZI
MSTSAATDGTGEKKPSGTYECGCHCGYIKFAVTLSPPLPEYQVLQCNCSACTRFGYLLIYPDAANVQWHNDGRSRCAAYQFNTKAKDQLFCPKCGASLAIDFRDVLKPHTYAVSARTIYGVNLDELKYKKLDGVNKVQPAGDLSGHYWDEEKGEMK